MAHTSNKFSSGQKLILIETANKGGILANAQKNQIERLYNVLAETTTFSPVITDKKINMSGISMVLSVSTDRKSKKEALIVTHNSKVNGRAHYFIDTIQIELHKNGRPEISLAGTQISVFSPCTPKIDICFQGNAANMLESPAIANSIIIGISNGLVAFFGIPSTAVGSDSMISHQTNRKTGGPRVSTNF